MRIEIARVAFSLACSMRRSSTFGSLFVTLSPPDRLIVPARSARENSRSVCRRPAGVAYQSVSAISDLKAETLVDLRAILPPLRSIHFIAGHRTKQSPPNSEYDNQVAAGY